MKLLVNRYLNILFLTLFLAVFSASLKANTDSTRIMPDTLLNVASKHSVIKAISQIQDTLKPFKPDPIKVVWMGAIIPGCGQIMNHKYWKLPIVYGSFMGCAYALTWNGAKYNTYRAAYRDIVDNDPTTNTFLEIIPKGYTIDSPGIGGVTGWTSILKRKQDAFRRYRDLSIIVTIGVYALSLVDAYVDAQLYDFDISPDLSLRFQPTLMENAYGARKTLGMQCCINLK
jgi:hypothetical protein